MKCLYCGGPLTLALLKKITGAGEFCSDECRRGYQSEFNRLAVGRLQQARANRRTPPVAGQSLPSAETPALRTVAEVAGSMQPIAAALADVPPAPVWSQSPLPPPAPTEAVLEIPNPVFLHEPTGPSLPVLTAGLDAELPSPALGNLFEAVHQETSPVAEQPSTGQVTEIATEKSASETEDEIWMAPRGLFPLTVRLQAIEAGVKVPHLSPAPIFVYLQLPESLIANSVGRPGLLVAPAAAYGVRPAALAAPVSSGLGGPLKSGLRHQLDATRLRVAERTFPSPAGFLPDYSMGLTFSWPAPAAPVVLPSVHFRPAAAAVMHAFQTPLMPADPRFDVYLRNDGRQELREKLRGLAERRANQRAMGDTGPTVTLPLKTVEPALNLLAAFGTAILERQNRVGDLPPVTAPAPAASLPSEELLPKLVAGLTALSDRPVGNPPGPAHAGAGHAGAGHTGSGTPLGSTGFGGTGYPQQQPPAATAPPTAYFNAPPEAPQQSLPSAPPSSGPRPPVQAPAAPNQPATPAYGPDGLPSGWPADLPPPAELLAPKPAPLLAPEPQNSPAVPPVAPSAPASPLPGMPGISGNVYMFGTEINAKGKEEPSTALARTSSEELEKPASQETESSEPNFTRPSGFPLSGGGMMNVGTMVVVNQPSGTVNINANSATASTFESRLRQKEPSPLSSIADPAGLQIPPPQPAKEMPLRMNFQGRLETALPVKWPELEVTAMRKKMFFGAPVKPRRAGGADSTATVPQPPLPRMPMANSPAAPEPAGDQDKAGAMGWIKSISNRFGKK